MNVNGLTVKEIPGLEINLDLIYADPQWLLFYRDRRDGFIWVTVYSASGHGEVPSTYRLNEYFDLETYKSLGEHRRSYLVKYM